MPAQTAWDLIMSGSEVVGGAGVDVAGDLERVKEARKKGIITLFCPEEYVLPPKQWKQLITKWGRLLTKEEIEALKKYRRKKLSCGYTRDGRVRRLTKQAEVLKEREELLKENASLKSQVDALRAYISGARLGPVRFPCNAEVQTCLVPEGGEETFCNAAVQTDEDASGLSLAAPADGAAPPPPLRDLME